MASYPILPPTVLAIVHTKFPNQRFCVKCADYYYQRCYDKSRDFICDCYDIYGFSKEMQKICFKTEFLSFFN